MICPRCAAIRIEDDQLLFVVNGSGDAAINRRRTRVVLSVGLSARFFYHVLITRALGW